MKKVVDTRRANLNFLVERDGLTSTAKRFKKPTSQIKDMATGRKSFGEKVTREMEANYDPSIPQGWLDKPMFSDSGEGCTIGLSNNIDEQLLDIPQYDTGGVFYFHHLQRQIILSEEQRSDLLKLARLHEEKRMKVKKFASEQKRYALTGVLNGLCLVYALKESMKRTDPPHWICTRCYENGKRSILNQKRDSGDRISLQCTECFSDIHSDSSEFELPKYV